MLLKFKSKLLDWKRYSLAAGSLHGERDSFIVGSSLQALQKNKFDLSSIQESYPDGIFKNLRFLLVVAKARSASIVRFQLRIGSLLLP